MFLGFKKKDATFRHVPSPPPTPSFFISLNVLVGLSVVTLFSINNWVGGYVACEQWMAPIDFMVIGSKVKVTVLLNPPVISNR